MILSDKQNLAAKEIKNWYSQFNIKVKPYYVLAGIAGSGKSSIVSYVLGELGIDNYRLATYTGMAACVLIKKGNKNVSTIHRLIYKTTVIEDKQTKKKKYVTVLKDKEELTGIDLIIIDEYSMVPDNLIEDLLSFQIPIIFIGDPLQLPPIFGDNKLVYDFFLDEPHRQALDNPILMIANYARQNMFDKIRIGSYGDSVRVFSRLEFEIESLYNSDQIICGKNATVSSLNKFYRSEFLNLTDNAIRDNEKIMCLANNWEVENSQGIALVNGLIGRASNISIRPKTSIYDINFTPDFSTTFKNVMIDKLLFEGKTIDTRTELLRMPLKDSINKLNEFIYAYAITTHKSQGSEMPYVTFFPEVINRKDHYRLFYTGVTRASEKLDIIL